jgi:glycosyltransferase involved in cell wall biosynthesis
VPKSIFRDAIFVLVARAHSVPVVIFFRGWDEGVLSVIKRSFGWLFRYVYGNVSGVIVLADEFRRELRALGFQTPIFQLTTCVDDSVFDHSLRPTKSGTILQILFLSRLDRGKGVLEAIRSFAILKRSVPNVMMTIAGDGPERQAAEHLVKKNAIHDISFVGYVQGAKKHDLYSESDIFFFPTFYGEGMPNSILEAMAYGLPIVTRAIGGLQDFFEDERMGFITDSIDEYKFASLLERLAKNPDLCREIGKYNIQYAKQHFSASVVANTLQDIYSDVIK